MSFLKGPKFDFHLHRKFSGGSGNVALDPAEQQRHQELERLYTSTRAGKHFLKDVVKGVENFVATGHKQLEVSSKLAEDCKKYGSEGPSVKDSLRRATQQYGSARNMMEKERENFHRSLTREVSEPLKAMAHGSPLEDARLLKQKYDRLRQDADNQASEVNRRKTKDAGGNPDHVVKLQAAEQKLDEITSSMETMGQNATSAMSIVESQQQSTTLQKMLAMVDAERAYFLRVTSILDSLHDEIEAEVQKSSSSSVSRNSSHGATPSPQIPPATPFTAARQMSVDPPESSQPTSNGGYDFEDPMGGYHESAGDKVPTPAETKSFYATATHDFEGEDEGELTISIGDEVLVRQVTSSGWSEGLCNGQSGWFPSSYVEKKPPVRRGRGKPGSKHGSR